MLTQLGSSRKDRPNSGIRSSFPSRMRCSLWTCQPAKKKIKPKKLSVSATAITRLNLRNAGCAPEVAAAMAKAHTEVREVRVIADAPSDIAIGTASASFVSGPAAFIAETKMKVQSTPTAATRKTAQMQRTLIFSRPT